MSSECSDPAVANGSAAEESTPTIEDARIEELREILDLPADFPRDELAEMLRQNDRVSGQSEPSRPRSPNATPTTARRRRWVRCQHPPPRPGFFRSGGTIEDRNFDLGSTLDEIELETKQIDAVGNVQQALTERLGYDLGACGQFKELEGLYRKGDERLKSAGIDQSRHRPEIAWPNLPAPSRESILRKEPDLPKITAPLPIPQSAYKRKSGCEETKCEEV
ncbi:hypothetical protein THAOC_01950 [Thalassiosira oceanica]|uniref:Uncharacterized protein n=1 Tax=Thalassiosira oceanica TaxID=159749 RepID=K0TMJ6_THAOC|nr:hypothetical protein THAOC_01950 [Thalassiosira oceanica]|eukprot:EJK76296.1 hypothetical protein THAOC_01950 [Thalassiosira oceanica]